MVMENYDKFLPNNSKVILDKIFYGLIESFRASYLNAIYYDLFEKYEREMSLIKSDNKAANLVNRAFKGVKNINAKVSHKSNIMQKLERTEIVERLFSEEKYKIYNFEWNVKVLNANTYEEKEILSNALESYDKFEDAIDAGVIEINSTLVIMNTVKSDISKFTDILKLKLDSNSISFDRYDVEFGEMFDDVLIEMLVDYVNLRDTPDINLDEDEIEDKYLIASDALNYLMYEYYLELRSLTLRLFNVYCYFINNNKKM